jgi:hypothetical protein
MILKNDLVKRPLVILSLLFVAIGAFTGCYSFKDVSPIPQEVKTFRVNLIENRARYINPQLSPQLTDKLRQKIIGQTRLNGVSTEDAHYDISGQITSYNVSTSGISSGAGGQQQAAINRLTVTVHLNFKNTLDPTKNFEADVSRNFDFSANLTLPQAEAQLTETIIKNMVDEIFNRIFSNW